ncbi:hypothetical protein P280DRAFT_529939 [Massarina eburnea CBS 473.64]|uniref:F-box domain-containing protein n=1 Tax=Massarina eburnea CBS 473.64 TaxID=1395130 RepID=A0A6A6RTE0_9PLEO|nr:hypothetical protein P280DRAFT_529939 [Massarina eburnea CBS 473.64]
MFMDTIVRRPDLASDLRQFKCHLPGNYIIAYQYDTFPVRRLTEEDIRVSYDDYPHIHTFSNLRNRSEFISVGSYYLLLMAIARKLEVLHIELTSRMYHNLDMLVNGHGLHVKEPLVLEHLTEIRLQASMINEPFHLGAYAKMLTWPNLRTFTAIHVYCASRRSTSIQELEPKSLKLRNIVLFHCRMNDILITHLLDACQELESFVYKGVHRYPLSWADQFLPEDLMLGLHRHKDTLTTLDLNFTCSWTGTGDRHLDPPDNRFLLPSFGQFKKLTHLSIEYYRVGNVADMPTSLEHLEVYAWDKLDDDMMKGLLGLRLTTCPHLRTIRFEVCWAPLVEAFDMDRFLMKVVKDQGRFFGADDGEFCVYLPEFKVVLANVGHLRLIFSWKMLEYREVDVEGSE